MSKPKKVLAITDLHCGSLVGLTPPMYQNSLTKSHTKWNKFVKVQKALWGRYKEIVKSCGSIDILLVLGDCIDGQGWRSGGTELITTDRMVQCDMAIECIELIKAKKVHMVYGTGYHTGSTEDWENIISERVGAKSIGSHSWIDVNGCVFDIRHAIGGTSVPYSKGTQISKHILDNLLNSYDEMQPKADVVLRGHIHKFFQVDTGNCVGMTLPALQGMGTKFGSRICTGQVDFGAILFTVNGDGSYSWEKHITKIREQATKAIKA